MSRIFARWVGLAVLLQAISAASAEPFTYQGQLKNSGIPMDGTVNVTFKLFDAATNGNQQGSTLTFNNLALTNGLFTVALDFGFNNSLWFEGAPRWLEIAVNGNTLADRQPLNPTPYALRALKPWQTSAANANDIFFTGNGFLGLGNVGIGDTTPAATLTVGDGDKFQVFGGDGHVFFNDPNGSIRFSDAIGTAPMIQLFDFGPTEPANRMILAHSINFPQEGLQYVNHNYIFRSAANLALTIDVNTPFVGVNRNTPVTSAEYFGIQAPAIGTSFGGMYIQTNSTTAKPFYGYSTGSGAGAQRAYSYLDGTTGDWRLDVAALDRLAVTEAGNVGIGTNSPAVKLHVVGGTDSSLAGGGFLVLGATSGANVSVDNNEIMARNNGAAAPFYLNDQGGDVYIARQGTAHVRVLEVIGADVAEKFPMSDKVEAGMVVMIDAAHPGELCLSKGPYNKRVAGVVSGANGLPAGTILGNFPGHEDAAPVALSGRVWVHCDASERAIDVGDMLTTSPREGHAMAVDDPSKAIGAVIGKAMTPLAKGEVGMVLVLVNLQ